MRIRLLVLLAGAVLPVLLLTTAAPAAAAWKHPLRASIGEVVGAAHVNGVRAALSCNPTASVAYYAEGDQWTDSMVGYPGSPVGSLPPGRVVAVTNIGSETARIQPVYNSTYYQVPLGSLCIAKFPTSRTIRAIGGGKALPNLQTIGRVTPHVAISIRRLAQIPAKAHNTFNARNGFGVLLTSGSIATVQGWDYLVGWECGLGRKCDQLSGLGNSSQFNNPAFITRPDTRTPDDTVAMHEYGHAVDTASVPLHQPRLSELAAWRNGPFKEAQRCWDYSYERNSPSEWFATSFEKSYSSVANALWLKKYCPKTFAYHRARFGAGGFDPRLPDLGTLEGELRTMAHSPSAKAAAGRKFVIGSRLQYKPNASARIGAFATYRGKRVGAVAWRSSRATSSKVLTTRGVPKGALVRICVTASGVGRGFAPIPAWCATAKAR